MLKPSNTWVRYNALTFKEKGITEMHGRLRQMTYKRRYWSVSVIVTIEKDNVVEVKPFKFTTSKKLQLSEAGAHINEYLFSALPDITYWTSCIVTASIMTEGGV